jgi:hypothetical protein
MAAPPVGGYASELCGYASDAARMTGAPGNRATRWGASVIPVACRAFIGLPIAWPVNEQELRASGWLVGAPAPSELPSGERAADATTYKP